MDGSLLQTKLFVPHTRLSLVHRPRLLDKLSSGLEGKLSLVCAPAGFGKTMIVIDFLSHMPGVHAAWLALDEQDNDPARFLSYCVAALQTLQPGLGKGAAQAKSSPQPPPVEVVLTALINDITTLAERVILVLDDYHLIENQAVHHILAFLLQHQPANLHLILMSRADPLLPLAQLRARGEMAEVREEDLRFTTEETAEFLNLVMKLELSPAEVKTMEERTEGWIAGLQLAALSMKGREDIPEFLSSFSGTHRFILDYLADEVLRRRPAGTKQFLLHTSILERLSGPLCDAVTGQEGGQTILEQLDQANLFIFPLDDSRHWYRYHRLFAELLRHKLRAESETPEVDLHQKACQWYSDHGYLPEGVQHALAARNWPQAAILIGQAADELLKRGQSITLIEWCAKFPLEIPRSQPSLGLVYAWALLLVGRFDQAAELLVAIETHGQANPTLQGQTAAAQAYLARARGQNNLAVEKSRLALALLPENDLVSRGNLTLNLGLIYWHDGRLREAQEVLVQAREAARVTGNRYGQLASEIFLARTAASMGRLRQAELSYRRILPEGGQIPIMALAHYDLGELYYEWNDLQRAAEHAERGLDLSLRSGNHEFQNAGHLLNSFIRLAQGDAEGAWRNLESAQLLSKEFNPATQARCAARMVQMTLASGDLPTAEAWADRLHEAVDAHSFYRFLGLTGPQLLIAQGQKDTAARQLQNRYETAREAGWGFGLIAVRLWQALAAEAMEEAFAYLEDALRLAAPERYLRTFADAGPALLPFLQEIATRDILAGYAREIIAVINGRQSSKQDPVSSGTPLLAEPLSERERDILRLLADRRTNAEIAQALIVSVNTVKTHLQHIYEKLGVHDRRQAAARARDLQLL